MSMAQEDWAGLSPDEKRKRRFRAWLNLDVPFVSSEAEEAYRSRVNRFIDAISLEKTPDRVPVMTTMGFFPGWYSGLTPYDCMHDIARASEAWFKYNVEFQPDAAVSPAMSALPAQVLEILDLKHYSWPGHGVSHEFGYQYHENEFMFADEYDALIADPTFFQFHKVLPRMIGAFEGIAYLETPHDMRSIALCTSHVASWGLPQVQRSLETLTEAGRLMGAWRARVEDVMLRIQSHGFPDFFSGVAEAPFDVIGDKLRGTKGIMLDLYQRPEMVTEACDRMVDVIFASVADKATPESLPCVFMPLHKGLDSFMSPAQFSTFYWPSLKKLVMKFIEAGFVPCLFTEGRYDTRLETICDLPKGKVIYWLNTTDMLKAKAILGPVGCLRGNVPVSMMMGSEPGEVTAHCRQLIETIGAGGGYILDLGAGPDRARPENVHALIRAAKEYGAY